MPRKTRRTVVLWGWIGFAAAAGGTTRGEEAVQAGAPEARVVEFHLDSLGSEDPVPPNPFGPQSHNLRQQLVLLRTLSMDPEVQGLRLHLEGSLDFARSLDVLQELRRVHAAKKKIVCYAESLDRNDLMFASVADLLVVPPSGQILLDGVGLELLYLRELLDKLGVTFEVMHIGEFKTAFEDYARDTMSDGQRTTLQALVDECYGQVLNTIAENRGVDVAAVESLFADVFVTPEQALAAGVIDAVAYEDQFDSQVEKLFEGPVALVDHYGEESAEDIEELFSNPLALFSALPKLLGEEEEELPPGPKIAIVYASGAITSGKSTAGFGGSSMGSETIVEALDEARDNDEVKAVILRVNSPGGSALASDMIWRAVQRVREKKPVIASMGSVAASGGYWISMGCDRILAQPSTITGSIGVVAAVPDLTRTLDRVGVNVEIVGAGPRVEEMAILRNGVTPFLRDRITSMMQSTYDEFVRKAAEGRKMKPMVLEQFAHGRVWTGRQAKEIGLVDALGGLKDAIVVACYLGGKLDPESTPVLEMPQPPDFFEQLEEAFGMYLRARSPVLELLRRAGLADVAAQLETVAASALGGDPRDWIQAVLPFSFRLR